MNKKFLSVALFGALLVASAGTFTSCKDYDDDIDAVNGRIDELVKSLSDLQAQVGGFVKSVDYNESTGVLTVVGADGKSHTYTVGKALPSYTLEVTADGKVILKKDGTTVSSGDIKFPVAPTTPEFDPLKLTIGADGVIMYDGEPTSATLPKSGSGSMVAVKDGDAVIGYTIGMGTEKATFYVVDAMPLKGLLIKPECYVGGIPSVQANNVSYKNWTAGAYAEPTKEGETYSILAATKASYITPQIWAYYHMNPASVTKNQISAMSFISDDKEYYPVSRASEMAPTVNFNKSTVETVEGQRYLKIAMDAKAENIAGAGKVSVYALQVTTKAVGENDAKVVTSDYGSIHKTVITNLVLKTKIATKDEVIYGQSIKRADGSDNSNAGKAKEAIDAAKDYTVSTTGEELDLTKVISTYGSYDGAALKEITNVKDLGLKYVYTPSNYISGDNNTPQNTFINLDKAAKGIVKPEYKTDEEAANTVGREPLIRVELVDTTKTTPLVVAVGWVKTQIVKGVTQGFNKDFEQGTYYYGCDNFDKKLTVINMNDVYHQAGLSYDDFHVAYKLDVNADNSLKLAAKSTGTVTLVEDNTTGTATKLLQWVVTPAQALAQAATSTDMFATVTFKSVDGTRGDITVTFKGTIAMPSGAIGDAQKITQYWSPDKKFVKLDVKEPVATAASEFVAQLYSFFAGNKITVDGVNASFTSFAAANLTSKFVFTLTDATKTVKIGSDTYTLSVVQNGNDSELKAKKNNGTAELVATIAGDVTDATNNGKLTYNISGANAKVLLNKSAYNEAPFTAAVQIVVTNACDEVLPLTNDVFDVKFLRPINANDKGTATLQDATTNGAKIDMSQLMNLTDWRGEDFALTPANFYTYYGIKGITIDKANIMTNMNQTGDTKKLLSEVTKKIDINYTYSLGTSSPVSYGDLTYYNNSGTITSSFKLYIPVTVEYTFGEVTANVTLTITPTH